MPLVQLVHLELLELLVQLVQLDLQAQLELAQLVPQVPQVLLVLLVPQVRLAARGLLEPQAPREIPAQQVRQVPQVHRGPQDLLALQEHKVTLV